MTTWLERISSSWISRLQPITAQYCGQWTNHSSVFTCCTRGWAGSRGSAWRGAVPASRSRPRTGGWGRGGRPTRPRPRPTAAGTWRGVSVFEGLMPTIRWINIALITHWILTLLFLSCAAQAELIVRIQHWSSIITITLLLTVTLKNSEYQLSKDSRYISVEQMFEF